MQTKDANILSKPADNRRMKALSIRNKLFMLRIGVGLVMGLVIASLSFLIAATSLQHQVKANLISDARKVSNQIQAAVQYAGYGLPEMAKSAEMEKYYHSDRKLILAALFQKHSGQFGKISYINTKGIIAAAFVQGRFIDREAPIDPAYGYLLAAETPNTTIIGCPGYDADMQATGIRFYYQYVDFFDNHLGTIEALVSLNRFAQYLDGLLEKNEGDSLWITDAHDRIIYGPRHADIGRAARDVFSAAMLAKQNLSASGYLGRQMVAGASSLVGGHPLTNPQWNVFIVKSIDSINHPLYWLCACIFFATLGVLVCGEMLSRRLGVKILEPITRFKQTTAAIMEDGDLEKRVEWSSGDEMGELADAFNSMLANIKTTQNQLQKERQFNENIIASITDLLIVVSREWQIMKINPNVCRLFGYHADELMGQPFNRLMPPDDVRLSDALTREVSEKMVVAIPEKRLAAKDGQALWLSLKVSEITDHNQTLAGYLITGKDIREELRLREQERISAEKLKAVQEDLLKTEKLAIVGQMSGMVAHEVLNPISAIYARLDLTIKAEKDMANVHDLLGKIIIDWQQKMESGEFADYFAQNGPKGMQVLEKIVAVLNEKSHKRVENLQFFNKLILKVIHIVDNLREMSRRKKTLETIDLIELIDEVLEDMGDGLRKRGIEIGKKYAAHPELTADYMEIYSVFSNLLKNAMQAIDSHRETNGDKKIVIDLWQDGAMSSVRIKDTGIGIDAQTATKLFLTGFSNKGREGTGLGLSYSRKIARQLGGDLFLAESMTGQGSTFQVNFMCQGSGDEKSVA